MQSCSPPPRPLPRRPHQLAHLSSLTDTPFSPLGPSLCSPTPRAPTPGQPGRPSPRLRCAGPGLRVGSAAGRGSLVAGSVASAWPWDSVLLLLQLHFCGFESMGSSVSVCCCDVGGHFVPLTSSLSLSFSPSGGGDRGHVGSEKPENPQGHLLKNRSLSHFAHECLPSSDDVPASRAPF